MFIFQMIYPLIELFFEIMYSNLPWKQIYKITICYVLDMLFLEIILSRFSFSRHSVYPEKNKTTYTRAMVERMCK